MPDRVLASPAARQALRELGQQLLHAGFVNRFGKLEIGSERDQPLADLALGKYVDVGDAAYFLGGPQTTEALLATRAAMITEQGRLSLSFEVLSDGKAMAIAPFLDSPSDVPADSVYAGTDTWLLRDRAWRYALRGKRALELGTGTGLVAAFLATRYQTVVATDINQRAAQTAQLSRELLPEPQRSRLHIVQNDIASGLFPRSFDFVCINAPWVPTHRADARLYSHGGETGFELPRRFITEGAELLTPGGILLLLCAELIFRDGSNPLRELLANYERRGFHTHLEPTAAPHPFHSAADATGDSLPGLDSARHVTVALKRSHR